MYHLIQDDDPYYTFVPSETADWLNLRTLTGANENKVLFELSDELKTYAAVRRIIIESGHHNFNYLIPPEKYREQHPDPNASSSIIPIQEK